jgi:hypothetical protein
VIAVSAVLGCPIQADIRPLWVGWQALKPLAFKVNRLNSSMGNKQRAIFYSKQLNVSAIVGSFCTFSLIFW